MKHLHAPIVHLVTFRDLKHEPVRPRPELSEIRPHHADMLRYDLGFHSPADTSLVIFPQFKHKSDGLYPSTLTLARWHSFSVVIAAQSEEDSYGYISQHPAADWITYVHPDGNTGLEPTTLAQWLQTHPRVVIYGWRGAPRVTGKYFAVTD